MPAKNQSDAVLAIHGKKHFCVRVWFSYKVNKELQTNYTAFVNFTTTKRLAYMSSLKLLLWIKHIMIIEFIVKMS